MSSDESPTVQVRGVGGAMFRAQDPLRLRAWYREHLGVELDADGVASFFWRHVERPEHVGRTVVEILGSEAPVFASGEHRFVVNYRVTDLAAALAALAAAGVEVLEETVDFPGGRLGWVLDPEGNRVELWEPRGEEGAP